jgi:hypothetical protein
LTAVTPGWSSSGPLEVREERGASLGLPLPALDLAQHDDAALGHHGERRTEREDRLRIELAGRALVEVEVAQGGVEGAIHDGLNGLVLQDVLGTMEVVDRGQLALRERAQERVVRLRGHAEL